LNAVQKITPLCGSQCKKFPTLVLAEITVHKSVAPANGVVRYRTHVI